MHCKYGRNMQKKTENFPLGEFRSFCRNKFNDIINFPPLIDRSEVNVLNDVSILYF